MPKRLNEDGERKATPVVWCKANGEPWVYPGWLMADNAATVRVSHSALKPGHLYYKPVYLRHYDNINSAVRAAEHINKQIKLEIEAKLQAVVDAKATLDAAIADYRLNVAVRLASHGMERVEAQTYD